MVGRKWWCWIVSMLGFSLCEVSLVQPGEVKSRVNQELLLFTLLLVRVLWHSLKTENNAMCGNTVLCTIHSAHCSKFIPKMQWNIYYKLCRHFGPKHLQYDYYCQSKSKLPLNRKVLFYISISYLIQSSVHCKVLKKESFVSNHHIPIYT